jgi:AcrR family transcriptional regulator
MTTKERILQGAHDVFQRNGFSGATMQAIAEKSGVNKALLHYHFGTKTELFHAILQQSFSQLLPAVFMALNSEMPLRDKLRNVVELYLGTIIKNPELPLFVISELQRNPSFIKKQINLRSFPPRFVQQVNDASARREIIHAEPADIMADLMGLCILPFVARPILQHLSGKSNAQYKEFLQHRVQHVCDVLVGGLFQVQR